MVSVRDHTVSRSDYKGREGDARDPCCPCRPCMNMHDCGHYQNTGKGVKWVIVMECATRHNNGCERIIPEAKHQWQSERSTVCKRCRMRRPSKAWRKLDAANGEKGE